MNKENIKQWFQIWKKFFKLWCCRLFSRVYYDLSIQQILRWCDISRLVIKRSLMFFGITEKFQKKKKNNFSSFIEQFYGCY